MGIRVPDQISVVGYDDIDLADVVTPALTTVHVPHRRMGQAAAELLISLIEDDIAPRRNVVLDTSLNVRASLALPSESSAGVSNPVGSEAHPTSRPRG